MTTQIKITTTPDESEALAYLAALEMRNPTDQLRWLLRQELLRRGLIKGNTMDDEHENPARNASVEVSP